ncbi:MAG TPA: SAM-dependent methyltransferase [Trebonia sp.]|nr:SAM-dependent methyltransferase [Trebonia sp.]
MRQFLDIGTILARAAEVLDFSQPVAVTLLSILHAIPDSDGPHAIVARVMDAVPSAGAAGAPALPAPRGR